VLGLFSNQVNNMQFNIISPSQFKTVAWKNGKGSTKELLFENIGDDDAFAWRLSMAPVTENGRFSDFGGYDRTLILVEGSGITLSHDSGQVDRLEQRFDSAQFDGGWIIEASLHQDRIIDFNVMTRQGVCKAQVDVFSQNGEHRFNVDADQLSVYPLDTDIELLTPGAEKLQLEAAHLLHVNSPPQGGWKLSGEAVICVQNHYLSGESM
jgi:environmental stress-induced protein Ves